MDYCNLISTAALAAFLPILPAGTATVNGAERIEGFQRELYHAVGDDPTVLLELRSDTLNNPYVTFNSGSGDRTLRGQVTFDLVVKTQKAGSDMFTSVAGLFQKGLWTAYPQLGITTTGLRIPDFRFNPSNFRTGRAGKWTVYRSPLVVDIRVQKSALIA